MNVLSIIHFPEFGGPQNQSLRLYDPLLAAGVESLTIMPEGPGAERLRAAGVPVEVVPLGRIRAVKSASLQARMAARAPLDALALARLFRRYQPDVVQLNGLINPHAALVARAMGIPVVWQLLDTRPPLKARKAFAPLVNALADVVMPIGNGVARAHPGVDFSPGRTVVFYPPVDTTLFSPGSGSTLKEELGLPPCYPVVGVVANVNPQKGIEYFIDAAARITAEAPHTFFVIAGRIYSDHPTHGHYYADLLEQAARQRLEVGSTFHFLGARDDIPNVVAGFDVFAMTSVPDSEGTPTVMLEAMACGLPIVGTNVGSVSEIVADGETGYVVPPLRPECVADRVLHLLRDPVLRTSMGQQGRKRAESEFSMERCVSAHVTAYKMAVANRRKAQYCRV